MKGGHFGKSFILLSFMYICVYVPFLPLTCSQILSGMIFGLTMAMAAMLLLLASISASICEPQIAFDISLKKKDELEEELQGLQELLLSLGKQLGFFL